MLRGPLGGQAVQRATRVVFLISDHSAYPNDKIIESLGRRPKIADAHNRIIEVGMKDRGQHAALRGTARIIQRQVHFQHVRVPLQDFPRRVHIQSL